MVDARLLGCGMCGVEEVFVGDVGSLRLIASVGILFQQSVRIMNIDGSKE